MNGELGFHGMYQPPAGGSLLPSDTSYLETSNAAGLAAGLAVGRHQGSHPCYPAGEEMWMNMPGAAHGGGLQEGGGAGSEFPTGLGEGGVGGVDGGGRADSRDDHHSQIAGSAEHVSAAQAAALFVSESGLIGATRELSLEYANRQVNHAGGRVGRDWEGFAIILEL